jgi:hypothetical protein
VSARISGSASAARAPPCPRSPATARRAERATGRSAAAAAGRAYSETRSPPTGSPCALLPRQPKLAADRLDRLLLREIGPPDLHDRLHYQHPRTGSHVPYGSHCDPPSPGARLDAGHPENGGLIPCLFTGEAALQQLTDGIEPTLIVTLSNIKTPGDGRDYLWGGSPPRLPREPSGIAVSDR